ncbi:MAG: hypothetical protein WCR79_00540 [Fusobacterium sp.]
MKVNNRKIVIFFFIISYIFIVKPVASVIELRKARKIKLKEINDLMNENKNLKRRLKEYSKDKDQLKDKKTNYNIKAFKNLGEYNSYINSHMGNNKIKILYIGRSILNKNSVVVSYNLKGKLYNFISFFNEIEKDKKIFLSEENFYVEKKGDEIIATINLEGNILRD